MPADFSTPILATAYASFLTIMKERDVDAITLCLSDPTNIPTGAFKYLRASDKFQEWSGAAWVDRVISLAGGGTGSASAAGARTNLGLGTMAVQDNNAVNITGGTIGTAVNIDAARITSNLVAQARLGSGSGGAGLKVLFDDQTWKDAEAVGTGKLWFTNVAPSGYLICDGSAISRATYAALFAVIGTIYGAGDGSTTFNLPDLRQRFPLGKAASGTGNTIAGTGGNIDHTHTGPSHTHTVPALAISTQALSVLTNGAGTTSVLGFDSGTGLNIWKQGAAGVGVDAHINGAAAFGGIAMNDGYGAPAHNHGGVTGTGITGASGTGATGTGNPPYLVVNYIIKS